MQLWIASGYMLVLGFGIGLPAGDYDPSLPKTGENLKAMNDDKADMFWRFIYVFPVIINIFMLTSFNFCIGEESIMFSLTKGDDEAALRLIQKIYSDDENELEILG